MRKTSFGEMKKVAFENKVSEIEYLVFNNAGRAHVHKNEELFFVTKGSGTVFIDDIASPIKKGDTVCIPRGCSHYMEPEQATTLELVLWHQD